MHIRDERLYDWLKDRHDKKVKAEEMAEVFLCHPNTIYAMVNRLESAGLIAIERSRRGGHRYKIIGDPCPQN